MTEVVLRCARFDSPLVHGPIDEWNEELGFTPKGGSTVEYTDFQPPKGVFLLAFSDHHPVGCGGLRSLTPTIGEIKRLFVRQMARRRGVGRILVCELERRAAVLGFTNIRLDSHAGATGALALFGSMGYQPINDYNGNPYASYWFEKQVRVALG